MTTPLLNRDKHGLTKMRANYNLSACGKPGVDPEVFFYGDEPDMARRGSMEAVARQLCASCPIAPACLLDNLQVPYGYLGATTPWRREKIARSRGLTFTA